MTKKLSTALLLTTLLSVGYHQLRLYHMVYITNLTLLYPYQTTQYSVQELQDYIETYKQDEIENGLYAMLGFKPKNYIFLQGNLGPVEEMCEYSGKQILVLYRTRYGVWTDAGDIYTPEALKIINCKENKNE